MNDEVPGPFDGLASALLLEEGWEVLSYWLEPTLGGGSGELMDSRVQLGARERHRRSLDPS